MPRLLRIVLIHTHLPEIVEIQLDQHANICGTNASGKTTIQRLIPVFYGEQPNRVVPQTRKKFDEFYLPYSNSYLIYEYRRESGEICHVVLTKKSDGGVDYRFIGAPYQCDFYLEHSSEGAKGLSYKDVIAAMHARGIQVSPKITATSEYRSIIQNDTAALRGNSTDSLKLRRLANSYSLVGNGHRLRHIEKLVSAVHAKEGKMDTLKAMLAAIFEEDGVTLPTTRVKNTKVREWIMQMRQSMRLDRLQQDFEQLKQLAQQLDSSETLLAALKPQLAHDEQQQKQQRADAEQELHELRSQLQEIQNAFKTREFELNRQLVKAEADLRETVARLDQLQQRYNGYAANDMPKLQRDSDALPQWRENLQDLTKQYQLMLEAHGDLERKLSDRKTELADAFNRLSEEYRIKTRTLQQNKDLTREKQTNELAKLEQAFQNRRQELQANHVKQLTDMETQIAVLQNQLASPAFTEDELEAQRAAELRLEQTQEQAQQQMRSLQQLQQQHQKARATRDHADQALEQERKALHYAQQQLQQLHRQLMPEQGSLRHFLRLYYPGWEQSLGKVLDEHLLERQDLQPYLGELDKTLYGLGIELNAIDIPGYAQDEASIRHRKQTVEKQVQACQERKTQAEKLLKERFKEAEMIWEQVEQAEWQFAQYEENIEYARDARNRLRAEHDDLVKQRQVKVKAELATKQQQLAKAEQQQQQDL